MLDGFPVEICAVVERGPVELITLADSRLLGFLAEFITAEE